MSKRARSSPSIYAGGDGTEPPTHPLENTLLARRAVMTDLERSVVAVDTSTVDARLLVTSSVGTLPRLEDGSGGAFQASFLADVLRIGAAADDAEASAHAHDAASVHADVELSPRLHDDDMYATARAGEHSCVNAQQCRGLLLPGGDCVLREYLLPSELARNEELRRADPNAHVPALYRACIECLRYDAVESWATSLVLDRAYDELYCGQLFRNAIDISEYPASACLMPNDAGAPFRGIVAPIARPPVGQWTRVEEADRVRFIQPVRVVSADDDDDDDDEEDGPSSSSSSRQRSF